MNQSVRKAFDVLSFVVENPRRLSLNQMADTLKMNKTTLFRFLTTLESLDILNRKDDYYVPGMKLFQWASKVPIKELLVDKLHPMLRNLTAEVNETVNLGEFNNHQVLYLDKTESQRSLQMQSRVGMFIALHCTALGKSILSILPEPLRGTVIGNLILEPRTPNTITDAETLKKQVEQVWADGYSTESEEFEEGLRCVAVPLLIEPLKFYGGLSCSGPKVRFTKQRMKQLAKRLQETVEEIKETIITGDIK